jgi:hypothetical protein
MRNRSYDASTTGWDQLLVKVKAHAADLPFLKGTGNKLAVALQGAREAKTRQTVLQAQCRKATRDLKEHMARSRDLATRLRNGIRMHYGLSNEKLADFKIRPCRPKSRARK